MRAITVRIPAAKRILDFGCGTGWFLTEAQVDGIPSASAWTIHRSRLTERTVFQNFKLVK